MQTYQGSSLATDTEQALREATSSIPDDVNPSLVLAFFSTAQDGEMIAQGLSSRFEGCPVIGCSTAGEHLNGAHFNGALVVMAICSKELRCAVEVIEHISTVDGDKITSQVKDLFKALRIDREQFHVHEHFGLLLIDGLSLKEEFISSHAAEALDGIPLIGGSAGDDLKFQATHVIANGKLYQDAAVILLAHTTLPMKIIKHQHFKVTPNALAITHADVAKRRVFEIDGYPAAQAYAHALGLQREQLTDAICFERPLIFQCQNQRYIRSVMKVNDDDSIDFYCAIEEGMVLDIGEHEDMVVALNQELESIKAQVLIGFNCILRALESGQREQHTQIGQVLSNASAQSIAFDTYGEQLNGLHINQTFVGLALGVA